MYSHVGIWEVFDLEENWANALPRKCVLFCGYVWEKPCWMSAVSQKPVATLCYSCQYGIAGEDTYRADRKAVSKSWQTLD